MCWEEDFQYFLSKYIFYLILVYRGIMWTCPLIFYVSKYSVWANMWDKDASTASYWVIWNFQSWSYSNKRSCEQFVCELFVEKYLFPALTPNPETGYLKMESMKRLHLLFDTLYSSSSEEVKYIFFTRTEKCCKEIQLSA